MGTSYTTKRGAFRLVDGGLARFVTEKHIEVCEADPRYLAEAKPAAIAGRPSLRMVSGQLHEAPNPTECADCHRVWLPDGTWLTCAVHRKQKLAA